MTTMHTMLQNKDVHFSLVAYPRQAGWWNRKGPTVSLAAWYGSCSWMSCGFTVHCLDCFVYILTNISKSTGAQQENPNGWLQWHRHRFNKNVKRQVTYGMYTFNCFHKSQKILEKNVTVWLPPPLVLNISINLEHMQNIWIFAY